MAKQDYDKEDGVWRTVGGRRIFIRNGQALSDAMKESGKFKKTESGNVSKVDVTRGKLEIKHQDALEKAAKEQHDYIKGEKSDYKKVTDAYDKENVAFKNLISYDNPEEYKGEKLTYLAAKHGNKDQVMTKEETMEEVAKDVAKSFGAKSVKVNGKEIDLSDKKEKDDYEYNLYKRARENEDSIDPMTENSTDWEALDKKYKDRYENEKKSIEANKPAGQKTADLIKESGTKTFADEIKEKEQNSRDDIDDGILERFGEDYGYDDDDNLKNLRGQIDYMRNPNESIHKTAERLVEGGDFLIYNDDIKIWLDAHNIKYNDDNFFDKYKEVMSDRIEKLYNGKEEKTTKPNSNYYEGTKRWGFGYANDDNIPVYQNKIDYSGDFTHANLSKVSNDDLIKIANKQNELYNEAVGRRVGDRRTYNGRNDQIYKDIDTLRYGNGLDVVSKEMEQRGLKADNQITNTLRQKAYQKYLKEHPNSKMKFEDFMKNKK